MNEADIKISVIVPVYNVKDYLKKALDSVLNQTLKEFEVICIDDCSTDGSLDILREYKKKDERIVLIENKVNKGQGYSRNIALDIAKGDYIMMFDPDDWYEPDALEVAYNQITKYDNDLVVFNYFHYSEKYNKRMANDRHGEILRKYENGHSMNVRKDYFPYLGLHSSRIYKKSFLIDNDCRYTETRCGEDSIFVVKTTVLANSISFCHRMLYNYRIFDLKNKYRKRVIKDRVAKYSEPYENRLYTYNFIMSCDSGYYKKSYIVSYINGSIANFKEWKKRIPSSAHKMYGLLREAILKASSDFDLEEFKSEIKYSEVKNILRYDKYWKYNLVCNILPSIFSCKNKITSKNVHKIINIMGLKLKFRMKNVEMLDNYKYRKIKSAK